MRAMMELSRSVDAGGGVGRKGFCGFRCDAAAADGIDDWDV